MRRAETKRFQLSAANVHSPSLNELTVPRQGLKRLAGG